MVKKIVIAILILICIAGIASLSYVIYTRATSTVDIQEETNTNTPVSEPDEKPVVEDTSLIYEETVVSGETFFEKFPKLAGEQGYLAYPIEIDTKNPPTLILYSHGSNTTITTNMKEQFMKDMRAYGKFFTKQNFAFAASSMHGANWGSDASVEDIRNLLLWTKENYKIQSKYTLLAHSMGGLPTFNFAFKYPKSITKIALLAPTSNPYAKAQLQIISGIPVHIWHGNADVNVPLSLSTGLEARNKGFGFTNITLEILPGKTHWDIDTELKDEILEFFQS